MSTSQDQLAERHFRMLAETIETRTGIQVPATKRVMVEGRLRRRVRSLGLTGLAQYGELLYERGGLEDEIVDLIDCMTTNKTDFFREPAHFAFLRDEAVPRLMARRGGARTRLKLWSAAASTGAEAYTIAMVLHEMTAVTRSLDYAILGTDISGEVLRQAERAVYPAAMLEPLGPALRSRFLLTSRDPARQEVRIVPELRRRVRFERLNLMDPTYPVDRDVDVIFCRNVLIYFDRSTQKAVLDRLAGHLGPGGYLIVGHSESMAGSDLQLKQVLPTVFQA